MRKFNLGSNKTDASVQRKNKGFRQIRIIHKLFKRFVKYRKRQSIHEITNDYYERFQRVIILSKEKGYIPEGSNPNKISYRLTKENQ